MPVCYLIGAGSFTVRGLYPKEGDLMIAADAGYTMLSANGFTPDLLVGDFDSLKDIPKGIPTLSFPPEKDETDLALALQEGMARGYRTIWFYGASGGREDHAYANLQLLGGASEQGCECRMICPQYDVYAVTNGTLALPELKVGQTVSVFCHGDTAEGVTLTGLRYPLDNATLTCGKPIGVSNEAVGKRATVSVRNGTLLVYVILQFLHVQV